MKITSIGYSNPYSTQKAQKSMSKTNSSPSFGAIRINVEIGKPLAEYLRKLGLRPLQHADLDCKGIFITRKEARALVQQKKVNATKARLLAEKLIEKAKSETLEELEHGITRSDEGLNGLLHEVQLTFENRYAPAVNSPAYRTLWGDEVHPENDRH